MNIQDDLEEFSHPYSRFHIESRFADSYSRKLDHEVGEWEQPYGYNIKPLEPEEYENLEARFGSYPEAR